MYIDIDKLEMHELLPTIRKEERAQFKISFIEDTMHIKCIELNIENGMHSIRCIE